MPAVSPAFNGGVIQQRTRVIVAGGDCNRGGTQIDGCQVVAHLIRAVAKIVGATGSQPAKHAVSPAFDGGVIQQRTRVILAGGEFFYRRSNTAQIDGFKIVAHLIGSVANIARTGYAIGRIARCAPTVFSERSAMSPTFDGPVFQRCARHIPTSGHGGCLQARPQIDDRQIVAHLIRLVAKAKYLDDGSTIVDTSTRIAVTEHSRMTVSPAFDRAIVQQRTRMQITDGYCRSPPLRPQVDGRQTVTHLT